MPRIKSDTGKTIRKEIRLDEFTQKLLKKLMETNQFSSEADVIRTAIHLLFTKYESILLPQKEDLTIHEGKNQSHKT